MEVRRIAPIGRAEGPRYDRVELNGREFTVSMACIESGWEYRLNGKWREENDPLVLKQQRRAKENRHARD